MKWNEKFVYLFLIIFVNNIDFYYTKEKGPKTIKIFYEPLCSDSVDFFNSSLSQFYKNLEEFKKNNFVKNLILIPGGLAKYQERNKIEDTTFSCMHGVHECIADKYHSCAIEKLDSIKAIEYILCYMKKMSTTKFGRNNQIMTQACAKELNFEYNLIFDCVMNLKESNEILLSVLKRKERLPQKVKHAPWVLIDNKFSKRVEKKVEKNMLKFFCNYFEFNNNLKSCNKYKNY